MIGNIGVSHGTEENGVKGPELLDAVRWHHPAGFHIRFAAPIQVLPTEAESKALPCDLENPHAFGDNFLADAVSEDNRNVVT